MIERDQIEAHMHSTVATMRSLSGGMIGQVFRVDLADGQTVVAKTTPNGEGTLDIEARMLRYLGEHSALPVPEVIYSDADLLIMTYIENSGGITSSVEEDAADYLAALHHITSHQYGLSFDTLIGGLHQPNTPDDSWIDFFREQRLLYMAQVAYDARQLSLKLRQRLEQFATVLEEYLFEPEQPALIHGDMWGGNVLSLHGKVAGFVDPAIYYAHHEIELAFSTLFNTFGDSFFERYTEHHSLEPDFFEVRRDIYNLYPLLVHVRLFGGGYAAQVESILRRFGY